MKLHFLHGVEPITDQFRAKPTRAVGASLCLNVVGQPLSSLRWNRGRSLSSRVTMNLFPAALPSFKPSPPCRSRFRQRHADRPGGVNTQTVSSLPRATTKGMELRWARSTAPVACWAGRWRSFPARRQRQSGRRGARRRRLISRERAKLLMGTFASNVDSRLPISSSSAGAVLAAEPLTDKIVWKGRANLLRASTYMQTAMLVPKQPSFASWAIVYRITNTDNRRPTRSKQMIFAVGRCQFVSRPCHWARSRRARWCGFSIRSRTQSFHRCSVPTLRFVREDRCAGCSGSSGVQSAGWSGVSRSIEGRSARWLVGHRLSVVHNRHRSTSASATPIRRSSTTIATGLGRGVQRCLAAAALRKRDPHQLVAAMKDSRSIHRSGGSRSAHSIINRRWGRMSDAPRSRMARA